MHFDRDELKKHQLKDISIGRNREYIFRHHLPRI